MDAYGEAMHPQYYQSASFMQTESDLWDQQHSLIGNYSNHAAAPTMERYLQETERSLFVPRWTDNCGIDFPGLSLEAGPWSYYLPETTQHAHHAVNRCPSPSNSGPASSYISSGYSDRQSTPISSPGPSMYCRSPEMVEIDPPFPYGGHSFPGLDRCDTNESCVAMHDIQRYADTQPEVEAFDEDTTIYYASYRGVHEGYIQVNGEQDEDHPRVEEATTNGETHYSEPPNFRHRRPQTTRPATSSSRTNSRISKRTNNKKRSAHKSKLTTDKSNSFNETNSKRSFPCPFTIYGCASTFASKNEWKRHVNTQHMRLGYWRCDLCDQADRKPNDFNRKDLFIQHIRRMHPMEKTKTGKSSRANSKSSRSDPEEQALAEAARRCWRQTRSPPAESGCLFCDVKFNGSGTWDERLEHIGRHMENNKKGSDGAVDPEEWLNDEAMEEWLAHENIIIPKGDGYILG